MKFRILRFFCIFFSGFGMPVNMSLLLSVRFSDVQVINSCSYFCRVLWNKYDYHIRLRILCVESVHIPKCQNRIRLLWRDSELAAERSGAEERVRERIFWVAIFSFEIIKDHRADEKTIGNWFHFLHSYALCGIKTSSLFFLKSASGSRRKRESDY